MNEVTDPRKQDERIRQHILELLRLVARAVVRRLATGTEPSNFDAAHERPPINRGPHRRPKATRTKE
jgi:hypothetical protein